MANLAFWFGFGLPLYPLDSVEETAPGAAIAQFAVVLSEAAVLRGEADGLLLALLQKEHTMIFWNQL